MMLIRVELYCHGFPDGRAPHGHVDVMVQGSDEQEVREVILSQVDRDFGHDHMVWDDISVLEEKENAEFDYDNMFATVIGGQGDALVLNPIGKQFSFV